MFVLSSLKTPFAISPSNIVPKCEQHLNLTEDTNGMSVSNWEQFSSCICGHRGHPSVPVAWGHKHFQLIIFIGINLYWEWEWG